MARYIANGTGSFGTAATWDTVTNTPTVHASTNITVTTGGVFTATFTAPNTVNACTGVMLACVTKGSTVSWTATLQESSVDTTATGTVTFANFNQTSGSGCTWIYIRFASPYTFTTTAAGTYRFKVTASTQSANSPADSGAANITYFATDDRHTAPVAGDDWWVPGSNATTPVVVTLAGTQSTGSGTDTAVTTSSRTVGTGGCVTTKGTVIYDTTADATLTSKGSIMIGDDGEFDMGTVAVPMPAARTASLIFDENGVTGNFGICTQGTAKLILQGAPKSSTSLWKAKYVSGTGTAASPLVVDTAVAWSVGDQIGVGPTNAVTDSEYRYIITVNSSTSYVLSSTLGGLENALVNTHTTNAWVLNIGRNVIIKTTNAAQGTYIFNQAQTAGYSNWTWVRFENLGINAGSKFGVVFGSSGATLITCDYCVAYNPLISGFKQTGSITSETHTGLIVVNGAPVGNFGAYSFTNTTGSKTFVDCFVMGYSRRGWELITGTAALTFTRCIVLGANSANSGGNAGFVAGTNNSTFTDCEVHCSINGVMITGATDVTWTNCLFGTKGTNTTDIITDTTNPFVSRYLFDNCMFSSGVFWSASATLNWKNMLPGSEVTFNKLNQTTNNHAWYTPTGTGISTGAGLGDTTVQTAGSLAARLAPESSTTGLTWSFNILAPASSIVSFFGLFQKNTAYASDVARVELWLPGSTVADASQTLSNTTGTWQAVSISANYTGTVDLLATVKVVGLTTTASAYLYADTFFNADTSKAAKLGALDVWDKGKPATLIVAQAVTAADVWTYSTTALNTANTTGQKLVSIPSNPLTVGKFLALK